MIALLRRRAETDSRPGERSDGAKLGLALEGGGMRGVVSAGMACALERLGLFEAFDAVYGTSAGAVNAAFFVARQTEYGTPLYWENINNRTFIDYFRLLSTRPVLSLEFLLEHVMVREKVLDWQAVIDSPVPLKAVAVSLDPIEAVPLSDFRSRGELFDALRASATIPIVAGPPVRIGPRRYIDGGMVEPTSYRTALNDGCTHVLVLPTLPEGPVRFRNPVLTDPIVTTALARLRPELARAYLRRQELHRAEYETLDEGTRQPSEAPYLFAVRPGADDPRIHLFERRRDRLIQGARAGMRSVFRALLDRSGENLYPAGWTRERAGGAA